MKSDNNAALDRARKHVLHNQAKVLFWPVLALSLVAWWRQGFVTALIGGSALYAFLLTLILASSYFERKRNIR